MVVTFATDAAQTEEQTLTAACPGLIARITFLDYDGPHVEQLCVAPQGFSISGGAVNLSVYDNASNGIFHNGFENVP